MIILNTIFPLFALLFLGSFLKQAKITNDAFLKTSDKLVYFIFFPAMLFWKIGSASPEAGISIDLCIAGIAAVIIIFGLSLGSIKLFNITSYQAGSFVQASFRFNTYIGMAIVINTLGEDGVRHFGILAGFVIPIINILAVSTLIWHSGMTVGAKEKTGFLFKALLSNPLIIGCILGIGFSRFGFSFPTFIDNTFSLMTSVTLPMALLSIGGSLSFAGLKNHTRVSFIAAGLKLVALPLIGYGMLSLFNVTGIPFKTGMIFFTLPTSTALYVLSSQLNSDTDLASASIMLSTLLSFFSLSFALLL